MSALGDDEPEPTLLFANPLGERPPRPSPIYATKQEHLELKTRVEATEKTLVAHAQRLTNVELKNLEAQRETQAQFKVLLAKMNELISLVRK